MDITIRQGSIGEVVALSRQVPELTDPYGEAVYREKLAGKPHLILVACEGLFPVGFKVGYQREADGSFYSWMGGVLPDFRRRHAARLLAEGAGKVGRRAGLPAPHLQDPQPPQGHAPVCPQKRLPHHRRGAPVGPRREPDLAGKGIVGASCVGKRLKKKYVDRKSPNSTPLLVFSPITPL
jgi:hypothetical protein